MENKFKKMTKDTLFNYIEATYNSPLRTYLGEKHLSERLDATINVYRSKPHRVTKKTLEGLCEEVYAIIGEKADEQAGISPDAEQVTLEIVTHENGVEPEKKVEETPVPEKAKKPKKKVNKESSIKKAPKKAEETPKTTPKAPANNLELATEDTFPATLTLANEDGGIDQYRLAHEIQSATDIKALLEDEDNDVIMAAYWNKRHLKQFSYFLGLDQPAAFPHDLDILHVMMVTEINHMTYALSRYTEALYAFAKHNIEEIDNVRVNNGVDYQIYVKVR